MFTPLFWSWGDVQTEDKCVPGKTNSVYNSLKQTWPWDSQGGAEQGGPGEATASRTRTVATVCRHRTLASDNATAGVSWAQL